MDDSELRWFGRTLPKTLKQLRVFPFSDLHYGNPYCSLKHAQRTLKAVAENPDTYLLANGDLIEAALKTSVGDVYSQKVTPQEQRDAVIALLMPVKDKVLGMTGGNHEARIYKETGIDISKDIAKALGVPYRAEGILLKISFGQGNNRTKDAPYTYWVYATHGYGGARTNGAKSVKVERTSTYIHADVYIMSHDHTVNAARSVYLLPDPRGTVNKDGFMSGLLKAHKKILVKSSAYVKWGGYAETGGFAPPDLETPIITFAGSGEPRVNVNI